MHVYIYNYMHIHVSPTTLLLFPEIPQKRPQLGPSPMFLR